MALAASIHKRLRIPDGVLQFLMQASPFMRHITGDDCLGHGEQEKRDLERNNNGEELYTLIASLLALLDSLPVEAVAMIKGLTNVMQDSATAAQQLMLWPCFKNRPRNAPQLFWTDAILKWSEKKLESEPHSMTICLGMQKLRASRKCMNGACGTF